MNKTKFNNINRQVATTKMIEKKVAVLINFLDGKVNLDSFPTSLTKFRSWENKILGLEKIGSPSSTNRKLAPHNARLIDQAEDVINKLIQFKKKPSRSKIIPLAQQVINKNLEITELKYQLKSLTTQLIEAKHSFSNSSLELAKLLQRIETLENSNKALRHDLILAKSTSLKVI